MTKNQIKPVRPIRTGGSICPAYAGAKAKPFFYGASMIALQANRSPGNAAAIKQIRNITNNLRFYNQVCIRVSLYHSANAHVNTSALRGHLPDVKSFAANLIDGALRQELDRETAVMARGENVAANQRRRRVLGNYLLSKPYRTIKNFYGTSMQKLSSFPAEASRESNAFHSDIIHERTDKTVYTQTQTQIERVTAPPSYSASISNGDLNRIVTQAAKQVERKMRTERERNGKW